MTHTPDLSTVIQSWIDTYVASVSPCEAATNHIDELLMRDVTMEESIELVMQMYTLLVQQLLQIDLPVQPMAVIPLLEVPRLLAAEIPDTLERIRDQMHDLEPPSLYMLSWQPLKSYAPGEDLRLSLAVQFDGIDQKTHCYYREFRYKEAMQNDWEYARGIFLEYFPDDPIML